MLGFSPPTLRIGSARSFCAPRLHGLKPMTTLPVIAEAGARVNARESRIALGRCRVLSAGMVSMQKVRRHCEAIAAAFQPQRIILFCAYAYGKRTAASDVDVMVLMPRSKRIGRRHYAVDFRYRGDEATAKNAKSARQDARVVRNGSTVVTRACGITASSSRSAPSRLAWTPKPARMHGPLHAPHRRDARGPPTGLVRKRA